MTHLPSPLHSISQWGDKVVFRKPIKVWMVYPQCRSVPMTIANPTELTECCHLIPPGFPQLCLYLEPLLFTLVSWTLFSVSRIIHTATITRGGESVFHISLLPRGQSPVLCPKYAYYICVCVCVCVHTHIHMGFPGGTSGKESTCQGRT